MRKIYKKTIFLKLFRKKDEKEQAQSDALGILYTKKCKKQYFSNKKAKKITKRATKTLISTVADIIL